MAHIIDANELRTSLDTLNDWSAEQNGQVIKREFSFSNFSEAFAFMARVALLAEKADHHPDWSNSYNKVTISLSTHSAGGVTGNDIALARAIDKLA